MKTLLLVIIHLFAFMACAADKDSVRRYKVPTKEEVEAARERFLSLARPLPYRHVIDKYGGVMDGGMSHFELQGDAKALARETSKVVLIYALWPLLDGEERDAEAFVFLWALLGDQLTFDGSVNPLIKDPRTLLDAKRLDKHWARLKSGLVHSLKGKCGRYLGKPGDWYPHDVLFDEESVLRGKTNEVLRAQYVEAMREALRKPDLASKNPLEVKNIFQLLSVLNAKEAAPEAIGHFFFSWKQGNDYRLSTNRLYVSSDQVEDAVIDGLGRECPVPFFLARRVGEDSIPLVLDRYSKTSAAERAVKDGGGCAPVFVLHYFVCLGYSRAQAVEAIEEYVRKKEADLTEEQRAVINSLFDAVRTGKYQADCRYFNDARGWSLSPANPIDPAGKQ